MLWGSLLVDLQLVDLPFPLSAIWIEVSRGRREACWGLGDLYYSVYIGLMVPILQTIARRIEAQGRRVYVRDKE